MSSYVVHVCQFDSAEHLTGRKRTYEAVRAAVVKAGRFSVFEATATAKDARLFTQLERDPAVVVKRDLWFPWIGPVTWANPVEPSSPRGAPR